MRAGEPALELFRESDERMVGRRRGEGGDEARPLGAWESGKPD